MAARLSAHLFFIQYLASLTSTLGLRLSFSLGVAQVQSIHRLDSYVVLQGRDKSDARTFGIVTRFCFKVCFKVSSEESYDSVTGFSGGVPMSGDAHARSLRCPVVSHTVFVTRVVRWSLVGCF